MEGSLVFKKASIAEALESGGEEGIMGSITEAKDVKNDDGFPGRQWAQEIS